MKSLKTIDIRGRNWNFSFQEHSRGLEEWEIACNSPSIFKVRLKAALGENL
jgi:hypothetical protein